MTKRLIYARIEKTDFERLKAEQTDKKNFSEVIREMIKFFYEGKK